jgi:hypothetical protein
MMALNICGQRYTREDIAAVAVPETTKSYTPIPHDNFLNLIQGTLRNFGYTFGEEAHVLNKDGSQYFGMARLHNIWDNEKFGLVGGWRSSYNKTLSASFVIGSSVFVCDNLAFNGEIIIGRKHTTNILKELPGLLCRAIGKVRPMQVRQELRYQHYQDKPLFDTDINSMIVQMIRENIVPGSKSEKLVAECYEPSHKEHLNEHKRVTAWTVFNAATESLKGTSVIALPKRTRNLHNMMDSETDFLVA